MTAYNSSLRPSRKPLKRSAIGAKRRASQYAENKIYAPGFEALLRLHRVDWWHCYSAQKSQAGWPDYAIFGDGWLAFMELKARSPLTNRRGEVSPAQERYRDAIEAAGGEWRSFCLPDDQLEMEMWLNERTGHSIWTGGRLVPPQRATEQAQ